MNNTKQPNKFTRFLRNNAALLLLIFCVLAIAAVVLAVTLTRDNTPVIPDDPVTSNPNENDNKPNDNDNKPTTQKVDIHFVKPLEYTGFGMEFTFGPSNLFAFNSTLKEWRVHQGVDLLAADGAEVVAMYDGTVIETGESLLKGSYVVVDHGDNVIATYGSLTDLTVSKGDTVKQGDLLGLAGASAGKEYKEGAHLHLEVALNDENVDPMPYVNGEIYRTIEVAVEQ